MVFCLVLQQSDLRIQLSNTRFIQISWTCIHHTLNASFMHVACMLATRSIHVLYTLLEVVSSVPLMKFLDDFLVTAADECICQVPHRHHQASWQDGGNPPQQQQRDAGAKRNASSPVVFFFWPKRRLGHPEKYLFSLSKTLFSASKYPKSILFHSENRSTVANVY